MSAHLQLSGLYPLSLSIQSLNLTLYLLIRQVDTLLNTHTNLLIFSPHNQKV